MIRFSEVPIGRRFKIDGREFMRIPPTLWMNDDALIFEYDGSVKKDSPRCINASLGGAVTFIKDSLMVELVDKCLNCKFWSEIYSGDRLINIGCTSGINRGQSKETFWCSEGTIKGD